MTDNVTDLDSFKSFLRERAREAWEERGIPYYLSIVATDLKHKGVNYHDFTGALKLSEWASKEEIPDTKLVKHPSIKAKVGFIPKDVEFAFDNSPSSSTTHKRSSASLRNGQSLIKFVESLAEMPSTAMAELHIPAKVLISLLKD